MTYYITDGSRFCQKVAVNGLTQYRLTWREEDAMKFNSADEAQEVVNEMAACGYYAGVVDEEDNTVSVIIKASSAIEDAYKRGYGDAVSDFSLAIKRIEKRPMPYTSQLKEDRE